MSNLSIHTAAYTPADSKQTPGYAFTLRSDTVYLKCSNKFKQKEPAHLNELKAITNALYLVNSRNIKASKIIVVTSSKYAAKALKRKPIGDLETLVNSLLNETLRKTKALLTVKLVKYGTPEYNKPINNFVRELAKQASEK
jgi:ribonuclease HI